MYWKFFAIVFAWTWSLWLLPGLFGWSITELRTQVLIALGGIAPTATGILLAYFKRDRAYWQDFWRRIRSFRGIGLRWYAFMVLLVPTSSALLVLIYWLVNGYLPELPTLQGYLARPLSLLPFAVFTLFFGPLPEEIGWRGFALDHLEQRFSWLKASLVLGTFWAAWHLPLFLIRGSYQYELLQGSFWYLVEYETAFFAQSVIMGWIYYNNGRSILSGVLFHFFLNYFGEVFDLPYDLKVYGTLIQIVIAACILLLWRKSSSPAGEHLKAARTG